MQKQTPILKRIDQTIKQFGSATILYTGPIYFLGPLRGHNSGIPTFYEYEAKDPNIEVSEYLELIRGTAFLRPDAIFIPTYNAMETFLQNPDMGETAMDLEYWVNVQIYSIRITGIRELKPIITGLFESLHYYGNQDESFIDPVDFTLELADSIRCLCLQLFGDELKNTWISEMEKLYRNRPELWKKWGWDFPSMEMELEYNKY